MDSSSVGVGSALLGAGVVLIGILIAFLALWLIGCFLLKKTFAKMGIEVSALIFVPIANMWVMASALDCFGSFKLFGSNIPSKYVKFGFTFGWVFSIIPIVGMFLTFLVLVITSICIYTRICDIADGRPDGDSSIMGLLCSVISFVYLVKMISILIGNNICTIDQFKQQGDKLATAVKQQSQPVEKRVYDPQQQRVMTTVVAPNQTEPPRYSRTSRQQPQAAPPQQRFQSQFQQGQIQPQQGQYQQPQPQAQESQQRFQSQIQPQQGQYPPPQQQRFQSQFQQPQQPVQGQYQQQRFQSQFQQMQPQQGQFQQPPQAVLQPQQGQYQQPLQPPQGQYGQYQQPVMNDSDNIL